MSQWSSWKGQAGGWVSRTSVARSCYGCRILGLVDVKQSFQPGVLKRQHGNLSVFSRCFWRPQSRLSDPEIVWMKNLWLSKLFGFCVFWEPSVVSWSVGFSYSGFFLSNIDEPCELGHVCHLAFLPLLFPLSDEEKKKYLYAWTQFGLNELLHEGIIIIGDNAWWV